MTDEIKPDAPLGSRIERAKQTAERLRAAMGETLVGQAEVVEQTMIGLFAGGHVLLEGAPGLGKTLLVRTLAACLDLKFSRIQFTPDLMPSDVIGTNVLVPGADGARAFSFHPGPLFGQIVLADEINRATPKTQSALLEAMQEHACTILGTRHVMREPFFVLATENPIEMEGTYPLPEAQLDRFLLKVVVGSPTEDEMTEILARTTGRVREASSALFSEAEVLELQALVREVVAAEPLLRHAAQLVRATDPSDPSASRLVKSSLRYGAGVRGAQSLILAAKSRALLQGRGHVSVVDLRAVAKPVLRHRLIRSFEGEADGTSTDAIVDSVIEHSSFAAASSGAAKAGK